MKKKITIAVILVVAVAFSFALVLPAQADGECNDCPKKYPIWEIFKDGTGQRVHWKKHNPNPRFAIHDPNGDSTEDITTWVDDLVLDKETGLVWERCPGPDIVLLDWGNAAFRCYNLAGASQGGFRLPTISEFGSLMDWHTNHTDGTALPAGHPFGCNVHFDHYFWSATTTQTRPTDAWGADLHALPEIQGIPKTSTLQVWCVRGGQGQQGSH